MVEDKLWLIWIVNEMKKMSNIPRDSEILCTAGAIYGRYDLRQVQSCTDVKAVHFP